MTPEDYDLERDERGTYIARFRDSSGRPCWHSLDTNDLAVAMRRAEVVAKSVHRSGGAS